MTTVILYMCVICASGITQQFWSCLLFCYCLILLLFYYYHYHHRYHYSYHIFIITILCYAPSVITCTVGGAIQMTVYITFLTGLRRPTVSVFAVTLSYVFCSLLKCQELQLDCPPSRICNNNSNNTNELIIIKLCARGPQTRVLPSVQLSGSKVKVRDHQNVITCWVHHNTYAYL